MNAFVLDASLALQGFTTTASSQVLAKRSLFDDRVAIVPHLWRFEVMNVTYLHIPMVSGQPLATLDHGLIKAADDVGVPCL